MADARLRIHYHRDFDGMVAAAVLARILRERKGEDPSWASINYDQRSDWESFGLGTRLSTSTSIRALSIGSTTTPRPSSRRRCASATNPASAGAGTKRARAVRR
jgi:hypothetical protein